MAKFGRLLAAFFLAVGLFAAAPAQAQWTGQASGCPLVSRPKIIADATYLLSTADKCWLLVFTNTGAITVTLPAPGLNFPPSWWATLMPLNGGTITLTGQQDQAGVVHKINLANSLALNPTVGISLQILEDMNWWGVTLGGAAAPSSCAVFNSSTIGCVPASGGGAAKFLNADASFVTIPAPVIACAGLTDFGTACRANTGASGHTLGFLDTSNLWSAGQAVTPVTVTKSGSTFTPDFSTGNIFRMTLDAVGMTIANPSNMVAGKCGVLELVQDGTGNRTITTWGGFYKFPGGTKPTLSTTGSAVDSVSYCSTTSTFIEASSLGNFQ